MTQQRLVTTLAVALSLVAVLGIFAIGNDRLWWSHTRHDPAAPSASVGAPVTNASISAVDVDRCHAGALADDGIQTSVEHTIVAVVVSVKNLSSAPCTLYGFPGASFINNHGEIFDPGTIRADRVPARVLVPPGGVARVRLNWSSSGPDGSSCPQQAKIRLIPPDETEAVLIGTARFFTVCDRVHVDPFEPS
ncbi:MAG: hypothetical protein QOD92_1824 [Acidimicrobiaceae bacterium]